MNDECHMQHLSLGNDVVRVSVGSLAARRLSTWTCLLYACVFDPATATDSRDGPNANSDPQRFGRTVCGLQTVRYRPLQTVCDTEIKNARLYANSETHCSQIYFMRVRHLRRLLENNGGDSNQVRIQFLTASKSSF